MIGLPTLMEVVYVSLVAMLGFMMIYPALRDVLKDFSGSTDTTGVLAFFMGLLAIGGLLVIFPLFLMMIALIRSLIELFISLFSGFELIYWSRTSKIDLALFILSLALSLCSRLVPTIALAIGLMNGGIYLVGIRGNS